MNHSALVSPGCRETAICFACEGEHLVGVISSPTQSPSGLGVVLIVGGPQYRVGSHRHFAELARSLAQAGHHCLRFDLRGMGDSTGPYPGFDHSSPDITAAIEALKTAEPCVSGIVLWGLCDAAAGALIYCDSSTAHRPVGLCLLNPWVRSAESLAQTHLKHWYLQRLAQPEFWRKLLRGGVGLAAVQGFFNTWRQARISPKAQAVERPVAHFRERMLQGLQRHQGPVLIQLSADDHTAMEFGEVARNTRAWAKALGQPQVELRTLPNADHTLSQPAAQTLATEQMLAWLSKLEITLP